MAEQLKYSPAATIFLNLTPSVLLALAIAALASSPPRSVALLVVFFISAITLQLSCWIHYRIRSPVRKEYDEAKDDEESDQRITTNTVSSVAFFNILNTLMKPSPTTICIFYSSSFNLILTMMIRLFSVSNFGGKPNLLDYGPKISKNGPAGDTNIAFEEADFDTIGHAIQGFLAAFLSYPAVAGVISKGAAMIRDYALSLLNRSNDQRSNQPLLLIKPCVFSLNVIQLLRACCTLYPFYSMIKRLRYTSFAQTSHANNTSEWCLGCILGVAFGCLVTVLVQRHLIVATVRKETREIYTQELKIGDNDDEDGDEKYGFGKASEYARVTRYITIMKVTEILSLGLLILFGITTFLTGLFFGLSWDYKEKDDKVNGGLVALFVCLNVFVYISFYFLSCWSS